MGVRRCGHGLIGVRWRRGLIGVLWRRGLMGSVVCGWTLGGLMRCSYRGRNFRSEWWMLGGGVDGEGSVVDVGEFWGLDKVLRGMM